MALLKVRNTRGVACRLLLFVVALCAATMAQALSIGDINLKSKIGEPLRASVALGHLGSLSQNELIVGRAPESDYRDLGVEQTMSSAAIRYELVVDAKGYATVELRTEQAMNEPLVDLVMEVRWPSGRAIRHFTLLLDLPPH